jgi:aspartyl-tRNA(Asn)/glutamyl-tRNA(Gln) amidotransferase subunit A
VPAFTTIGSAARALERGETTASALVEAGLAAIAQHGARTNAFIQIDAGQARAAAAASDRERAQGIVHGLLHGIPISVKDLIDVAGQPTTAASRVLAERVATADATVITRLREAGAILLGKTNLHEFALGTTSEDSAWGAVRHPLDESRSPGGSSGGSAVAVATGMSLASIGTDTGGSIRIPAAACGIVGLKPSRDDVPTDGVVPLSPTLDHVGPLTRCVQDAAWIWSVLAAQPVPATDTRPPGRVRVKILGGYFRSPLAPAVQAPFDRSIERLRAAGIDISVGEIAATEIIATVYVNLVLPEAAHLHRHWLDTRAESYTPAVRARLESGRQIPAVAYFEAMEARQMLRQAVDAALDDSDALVLPTLPIVAPPIGVGEIEIDPARPERVPVRTVMLKQTQLFNITGHPAISLPLATSGLPVGLQLVGRREDTPGLLAVASMIEGVLERGQTPV